MSEEEIIEIIEKLQCEYKEQENDKKYNDYTVYKAKEYSKGLQGLLDLYNKEKEKNKLLIEGKFREVADKNSYIKDNYINKDKIREKIEKLKKEGDYRDIYNPTGRVHFMKEETDYKIEILQELLEEE